MVSLANPAEWLLRWSPYGIADCNVSPMSILGIPSVWNAINKITGHVGQLPLNCHKRMSRGATYASGHVGNLLLRGRPNRYQTPIVFKRQLQGHALVWGNGRAAVVRSSNQRITELIPLMPDRTTTCIVDGEKYHVTKPKLSDPVLCSSDQLLAEFTASPDKTIVIHDDDVLHIPGFGYDGVAGLPLIIVARQNWSNQLGTAKQVESQSKKGPTARIMLEAPPGVFRDEQKAKEFLDQFKKHNTADGEGETVGMLRDGIKASIVSMNNRDAQFIEQRVFDRQDNALWFLLESILGDDQSVSYNSLEQKNLAYLSNCLNTWLVTWEEECNSKLLTAAEFRTDSHYFKFNTGPLLRSDMATTITTLGNAIANKIMNPNEAREKLDMNPYDGGDKFTNPAIDKTEPDSQPSDNKAIENHLRHLIGVEAKRVATSAHKKGFVAWAETFYNGWKTKLGDAITSLGGDTELAREHCDESWSMLIDCVSKTKDLAKDIAELVESWPDRSVELAKRI